MRSRTLLAAVTAALLSVGAAAAVPAAAHAAGPVPPKLPLTLSVTSDTPAEPLQPGGGARSVTIKINNPGAKTVDLNLDDIELTAGPLAIDPSEISARLVARAGTPATGFSIFPKGHGPHFGTGMTVYPKGNPKGAFEVPAHATFVWKLNVGVGRTWPANDGQIGVGVVVEEQHMSMHQILGTTLYVGKSRTGGPILESLSGATTLSPRRNAMEKFTVTNHSGAPIAGQLHYHPDAFADQAGVALKVYQWIPAKGVVKAHWQDVTKTGFALAGMANNASTTVWLQVRVPSYTAKAPSTHGMLWLFSDEVMPTPDSMPDVQLTVLR
ncbi:hypothetical protein [Streptacidiphilus rugosus]|uniref:hypothetical protein n=1 Tax=Streptacidiphilus rugosus TaxID=405783 RepID=UPI000563A63D|nr:hypothetical protein [Streptacidiphilus rugosus]